MSRSAFAVRHVPFEGLGLLAPLLAERGYNVRYLDAGIDEIGSNAVDADLLVVLGGPIGVGDVDTYPFLLSEEQVIADRIAAGRPVLGICLGGQLIAAAMGAEVSHTGRVEIGYADLHLTPEGRRSVLAPLSNKPVLHWHGDQFAIPDGAVRLAETPGFPNQAFAVGDGVLSLQFHIESDHTQIERWLIGHAHELASNRIDPSVLRAAAAELGPSLAERAQAVLGAWLDQLPAVQTAESGETS